MLLVSKEIGYSILGFFNALRLEMQDRSGLPGDLIANDDDSEGAWWVEASGGCSISINILTDLTCSMVARESNANQQAMAYSNIADPKLLPKIVQMVNKEMGWNITVDDVEERMDSEEAKQSLTAAAFPFWNQFRLGI